MPQRMMRADVLPLADHVHLELSAVVACPHHEYRTPSMDLKTINLNLQTASTVTTKDNYKLFKQGGQAVISL